MGERAAFGRRLRVAAGAAVLAVGVTLPVIGAGAGAPTTLYAFASGSGSTCTSLGDDCSLGDALSAVADSSTTVIDLESVGSSGGEVFDAPSTGWALDVPGATVTIQPDPSLHGGQTYLDGSALTTISAILNVESAAAVTLSDLAMVDGDFSIYGGAVNDANGADLTVTDCLFDHDSADDGGAIDIGDTDGSGSLTVTGSTFEDGSANDGGAIDVGDVGGTGTVSVTDSTFTGNIVDNDGGAIDVGDNGGSASLTVTGSTFTGGFATRNGGAIDSGDATGSGTVTVTGSTFTDNSTGNGDGGAIDSGDDENNTSLSTGVLTVTGSTLDDNTAYNTGGAIDSGDGANGTLTVTDSTLDGDTSTTGAGGAIDTSDGTGAVGSADVTGSTFTDDYGGDYGGAIANADDHGVGTLTVDASTFDDDVSTDNGEGGGAISNGTYFGDGTLYALDSTFDDDGATYDVGGAIANGTDDGGSGQSTALISADTFADDSAYDGGALANGEDGSGIAEVVHSTFSDNSAVNDGSAIANGVGGAPNETTVALVRDTIDSGTESGWAVFTHQLADFAGSVVAGTSASLCDAVGAHASLTSLGYDVEADASSCDFTAATDQRGVDPELGALGDNGGPTLTELPSATSPLVNVIPSGTTASVLGETVTYCDSPDVDQRGVSLTGGQRCTIGAVDVPAIPNAPEDLALSPTTSSVTATWQPPSSGATPTGYVCTLLYAFGSPSTFTVSTGSATCTFAGLSPSTAYGVSVVAVGPGGTSPAVAAYTETLALPTTTTTAPSGPVTRQASITVSSFAAGSASLTRALRTEIAALRWRVIADGSRDITVVGYTASPDSAGSNRALGAARASAVAAALRTDLSAVGWAPVVIVTGSKGASSPIASNATAAGRARNRRVVVTFTYVS